jgi:hypothetical protein
VTTNYTTRELLDATEREIARARQKFPGNRFLLAALQEEVGELARELLQKKGPGRIIAEAIQVAGLAIRIAEEGDAIFALLTDEEAKA